MHCAPVKLSVQKQTNDMARSSQVPSLKQDVDDNSVEQNNLMAAKISEIEGISLYDPFLEVIFSQSPTVNPLCQSVTPGMSAVGSSTMDWRSRLKKALSRTMLSSEIVTMKEIVRASVPGVLVKLLMLHVCRSPKVIQKAAN